MKIGIFDSGIGGLSVLYQAVQKLPGADFLYYADEEHVPYGTRPQEEVIKYTDQAVAFLAEQGAQAVVIACNTATSAAIKYLRANYPFPIIGMEPAIKKAIDTYGEKRVLAVATPITVKGQKMQMLIEKVDKEHLVDLVPLPKLVEFAEQQIFDAPEVDAYLMEQLGGYDFSQYATLVLGCTHFNYFKSGFRRILPETMHFVDGNEGTINHLISELERTGIMNGAEQEMQENAGDGSSRYFSSGDEVTDGTGMGQIRTYLDRLAEMLKVQ